MKIRRNIRRSWKALLVNRSRTAFAVTGLSLGISTVMVMVSIGSGARQKMTEEFEKMGSNMIVVNSGKPSKVIGRQRQVSFTTTLKPKDAAAILEECPSVAKVVPTADTYVKIRHGSAATMSMVQGATSDFPEVKNFPVAAGRFFTEEEDKRSRRVAILGSQIAGILFGDVDPLGEVLTIRNIPFEVIGVLAAKGVSADGANEDKIVVIPLRSSLRRVLNRDYLNRIFVQASSKESMSSAEREMETVLRRRHRLDSRNKENDFTIDNKLDALNAEQESSSTFSWLIAGTAGLSLLVGGVGILAVMLLSIRERTGEIGLRISVGARKRDIIEQFLSEASMLGIWAGLLGVAAGLLMAWIIEAATEWRTAVSVSSVVLSVGFSMAIGLLSGVFPALKAANLDPIKALQKE